MKCFSSVLCFTTSKRHALVLVDLGHKPHTRAQGRVELGFARTSTFLIFEEQILSMLNLNIKMKKTRVIMEITALVSI